MPRNELTPGMAFTGLLLQNHPDAIAWITGDGPDSTLNGSVKFYSTTYGGILVEAQIFGLPGIDTPGSSNFYAMHIHESGDCSDHSAIQACTTILKTHRIRIMPEICRPFLAARVMLSASFMIRDLLFRTSLEGP